MIEERGVLVAGDMLSDVLIPLLGLNDGHAAQVPSIRERRDSCSGGHAGPTLRFEAFPAMVPLHWN